AFLAAGRSAPALSSYYRRSAVAVNGRILKRMPACGRLRAAARFIFIVLTTSSLMNACGADPPDKEMGQAQGAIDAARAAGADEYAHSEYTAATEALKQAQQAVVDRDYRLALNHALDSRERAQNAAKEAADQKAIARSDADRALRDTIAALDEARSRIKPPPPPRTTVRGPSAAQQ